MPTFPVFVVGAGASDATLGRGLLRLAGDWAPTRYAPGALDRAAHAQERFGLLAQSFARWSGIGTQLPLLIVEPERWSAAGLRLPVGLAERTTASELALPAWGSGATVALWGDLLDTADLVAPLGSARDEPVRGTRVESASLALADLTGQLVASRLLLDRAALEFAPAGCAELVAAAVARAAFERYEANRLSELRALFGTLSGRVTGPLAITDTSADDATRQLAAWARFYLVVDAGLTDGADAEKAARALLRAARDRRGPLLIGEVWKRLPAARTAYERGFVAVGAGSRE